MKVIKPQKLGVLQRVVEHERRCTLVVAVISYAPMGAPRRLLGEVQLWNELGEALPGGILDEVQPKPRGEVLVTGRAFARDGVPAPGVEVRVTLRRDEVALVDKRLAVVGNRYWIGGRASAPVPFVSMPVDYAHAFGGAAYALNPIGKGIDAVVTERGEVVPLPNVEDPREAIASPEDRPAPAGLGPYDLTWPQRFDKMGKRYDAQWLKTRFPGPAEDFDVAYYNAAPVDQQIDGYFDGSESYLISGMHPSRPLVEGRLEPLRVRVLATLRTPEGERFVDVATRLDTLHFFPEQERIVCVHRALIEVREDDADDVVHLVVAAEDPAVPRSVAHYQRVLAGRLDKDKGALLSLRDADLMPPEAEGWSSKPDYGDMAELTRTEGRRLANAERGRKKKLAEARAELEAAGFDVAAAFEEPDMPPQPDPYDVDAILAYSEEMEARAEVMRREAEEKKAAMEAEARAAFEEAGYDYDAEMENASGGGPPDYSADAHLVMLHDMARIAHEGGQPMDDLERDLTDPRYEAMLRELETRVREAYVEFAHMMPPAKSTPEERALLRVRVMAAKDAGEPMAGQNLCGADLRGLDLRGIDLAGAFLEGADLSGADLRDAKLAGAVLARADLTGTDFAGCDLQRANLGAAKLAGTKLSDANLRDAVLMRAEIDGAVFHGATLSGVDFIETRFVEADLSHAEAEAPLFLQTDLRGVTFTGASMKQARFVDVELAGVDFTGAELERATFVQARCDDGCFAGANLTRAVFVHETTANRAVFAGARMASAHFRKTPLAGANFDRADFAGGDMSACDLRGASLHQIVARDARMVRSDLSGANLRGADLLGAVLQKAKLHGADLTGSNLSRADVSLVWVDGATSVDEALMLDTRVDPRRQEEGL